MKHGAFICVNIKQLNIILFLMYLFFIYFKLQRDGTGVMGNGRDEK